MDTFRDDFDAQALDTEVWFPHYLPAWSSREQTAASFALHDSVVRLFIPADAGSRCVRLSRLDAG